MSEEKTPRSTAYDVYMPKSASVVSFGSKDDATKPATPDYTNEDLPTSGTYQRWGSANDAPKVARLKIEGSTTANPLIFDQVARMFGRGIVYYKEIRKNGVIEYEFPNDADINEFFNCNDINYLMLERLMDYKYIANCFCEFIKNKGNSKINTLSHLEAEFSRFGELDTNKIPKTIKYTGDWSKPSSASEIPYIQKNERNRETMVKYRKKFAIHSCMPSPGHALYAKAPHAALFKKNGWLDYANSVPEILNAVNENAMNLRYHIQIPDNYWSYRYKDWDTLDADKQKKLKNEEIDIMDAWLTGKDNAGKTFISHFATDSITGKEIAGWKITALDDKYKKDSYNSTLQEADIQTARALRTDLSLAGIQTASGSLGAGSGSDKRVSFHNAVAMSYADVYIITEPLRLVQKYNGWDPDIKFGFWHDIPTTLNQNSSGTESKI